MSKEAFLRSVEPLEHVLEEAGWNADKEQAANHLLVRRLRDQGELRVSRVDEILDEAQADGRALKASEKREAERLQAEMDAIADVVDEAREICDNPDRARHRHIAFMAEHGGGIGSVQRARSPLAVDIPASVVREMRDAVSTRQWISRQLSTAQLEPTSSALMPSRGRLAEFTTVRTANTPQSAFLAVTPTAPAAPTAEGIAKPEVATTALITPAHQKIAGYVELSREQVVYGVDAAQAVESVAVRQLIEGENIALVAALAGATPVAAGTTPAQSILAGKASVSAGGGSASVIAIAPADMTIVLGEQSATAGYPVTGNAVELATALWGVPLVPAFGIAAGTAYVWDSAAVGTSVAQSPTLLVDPYSQAKLNLITVVIEELVAFGLIAPTAAAKVDLVAP